MHKPSFSAGLGGKGEEFDSIGWREILVGVACVCLDLDEFESRARHDSSAGLESPCSPEIGAAMRSSSARDRPAVVFEQALHRVLSLRSFACVAHLVVATTFSS